MGQKLKIAGWISIGAMAGALTTVQLQAVARGGLTPLPLEELQQLAAVFGMIKSDYVEPVDEKKLIGDAISGMVSSLDPHSAYFDKKSFKEFREGTSGRFVGVGIEISQEDGLVKVVSPIEGSPADRAGLKPNDLITRIDDTAVKGLSLNDAVKKMRGEPKSKVVLTIFRKDESRTFPVSIIREEIKTQSVRSKVIEPGYAWIRLSQFQERTVDDFVTKLEQIYKQDPNLKGLVLDLRNDPGGLLDAAVAVSSAFLPQNVTVVSTNGQLEESKFTYKAAPEFYQRRSGMDPLKRLPAALKTVPLIVLVNEGSASASEIVAGALQDHKRAVIMGTQTFGKGSVQTVRPLGPDTGIKLTTARYYTPSGKSIQARGIVPDVLVDDTADGSPFAALRTREADLEKHLNSGQGAEVKDVNREKAREEAMKRLDEEARKTPEQRRPPELGSDKDFQLAQAINKLKGKPVLVSKTALVEAKNEKKDN
ncbi:MAG: peptidase S41 [Polaromonas sp. 39-63-203]|jgi:carboxyl-terminal processing protease|uniref:S41 family peptidase n=1 Tax=Polaromonas sp. TaxID=1869339 RepID=UPI000BC69B9C|nr:S41 family peptidase [Polaromonas sp.]OYY51936.1 MAG: peptidase S41 [Polaromonas sp. 35-63-240]OYZ83347.1 MAG: peptidase S41 [Polaromonas sp. 24-62-144]OZA96302.1 MAG: peptidase S41 [Polaromonas sp. 39-63-203]HQS33247.1 S41 family peptidase [Polaromonas sp.]HQS92604.1 S41 family peptidase [Polaromonas sp.]